MKILVIICSGEYHESYTENIRILNDYLLTSPDTVINYCGIMTADYFPHYENIINFKYKIINKRGQFTKICDFITDYKSQLDYDWFVKIRPDIKLLEMFDFNNLSKDAINARARVYNGPKKIKFGMSVNGEGPWKNIGDCQYNDIEKQVILDDQMYIFHKNILSTNAFNKITSLIYENEWMHSLTWDIRDIPLNVIGLNVQFTKINSFSGDVNM
jgi:hypothetical protein